MKRTQLAEAEQLIEVMVLSGKFSTPNARYDWFQRVRTKASAALTAAEGKETKT